PQFLLLSRAGKLEAAMPLFAKNHSYGEYVFDWAWAEAHERHGIDYYPKLVCAVPFTPVRGPRLLAASDRARRTLVRAALELARRVRDLAQALGILQPLLSHHLRRASLLAVLEPGILPAPCRRAAGARRDGARRARRPRDCERALPARRALALWPLLGRARAR